MRTNPIALGFAVTLAMQALMITSAPAATQLQTTPDTPMAISGDPGDGDDDDDGLVVLYAQLGSTGYGAQVIHDTDSPDFDSEGADDFSVTNAAGWIIGQVEMQLSFNAPMIAPSPAIFDISFYADGVDDDEDEFTGVPGEPVCVYAEAPGDYSVFTGHFTTATINLPTTCELPQGRYWLSITPKFNFADYGDPGEQSFWAMSSGIRRGLNGVWRNPGGGYDSACADFQSVDSCISDVNNGNPIGYGQIAYGFRIRGIDPPPLCSAVIFADGFDPEPIACTPD